MCVPPAAAEPPSASSPTRLRWLRQCGVQLGAATLVWGLLLSCYDQWLCVGCAARSGFGLGLFGSTALGAGAIVSVVWPLALVHQALWTVAGAGARARMGVALIEATCLAWLLCFAQSYASVSSAQLWLSGAFVVGTASLALQLAPRLPPRATLLARAALVIGALTLDHLVSVRRYPWVHLAADVAGGAAFLALARPLLARAPALLPKALALLALALLASAPAIASASMWARGALYRRSTHARVHGLVLGDLLTAPAQEQPAGARTCPVADDAPCAGFVADPPNGLSGSARGADLLLLSMDSLRWDRAQALAPLWKELGPHVTFRRAWSPAPRTIFALGALLRGRPLRQVPIVRRGKRDLVQRGSETLGPVLARAGYRAVFGVTHSYLEASTGVVDGFEQLADAASLHHMRSGAPRHFPTELALPRLLVAAGSTRLPLAAWVHAMETHTPYRAHGRKLGDSPAAQREAAGVLGEQFASFVRAFRRARGTRPLVVAVFADHGEEFGEHGDRYHATTVHAEQVRVTFALAAPGLPARVVDAPVSTAALPATLFDLLGIERPCTFTLPSLLSCMTTGQGCPELAVSELAPLSRGGPVITGYAAPHARLLKDDGHQLIHLFAGDRDAYELDDLAERDAAGAAAMLQAARAWDERYCVEGSR